MNNMLKLSLIISIAGIIGLFLLNSVLGSPNMSISDINNDLVGQKATIQGEITSLHISKDGHAFLDIKDKTGELKVVVFKEAKLDKVYELEEGQDISISGKIKEYKGELELIASKIN